ncbi:MAG: EF-P lysine aminoacylase EpmA [Nevskiales bacterium]
MSPAPPSRGSGASLDTLRARAQLYARVRAFFAGRGVLEVDTPRLSAAATVDPNIHSWLAESTVFGCRWLHTSPEFPMKRLLAAGSGPIYQICHVFREDELGRLHNPEFTMLEWYRPGFDHHRLMDEMEALLVTLLPAGRLAQQVERLTYREAVLREAGIDPFTTGASELRNCLERQHDVPVPANVTAEEAVDTDFWLDLLMGMVVGPRLGQSRLTFIYDYPASQAALARIRPETPPVAERFELYWRGVELANGFHELGDAAEQRRRFIADQARRRARGQVIPPLDENLLAALEAGLPDCAGVALGLDRLLMLALNLDSVSDTLTFPFDCA